MSPSRNVAREGSLKNATVKLLVALAINNKLNFITINHGCSKFNVHDEMVDYIKFPGCKKDATLSNTAFVNCTYIARFKTEKGKLFVSKGNTV